MKWETKLKNTNSVKIIASLKTTPKKKHPLYYSSNRLLTIVSILGRASGKNRNKVTLFESKLPHKRLITTYLPWSTISKLTTILKLLYSSWPKFTQTNVHCSLKINRIGFKILLNMFSIQVWFFLGSSS